MESPAAPLIAFVDDEEGLRSTVALALRKDGYRAETFADGLEAWTNFQRALPDLAILDILMPRLDGLELCRRLRTRSEDLPILFLSSKDEELDRVLGLELGDAPTDAPQLHPYALVERIFDQLRNDDIVVCGNASACILPFQVGQLKAGQRMFSNSGSASMGYDLSLIHI